MSPIREQLLGICVSIMLIIFVTGSFSIFTILFWSSGWALIALCIMLVSVSAAALHGYQYGQKLIYGFRPSMDSLSIFLVVCLFASMIISVATLFGYAYVNH
ncbi:MAG TPA: hypothetical protein DCG72_11170 [Gammaproteobacteria bacterium]|nr:hypothetical protein [Gammaproteobacteria bacterium]